MNYIGENLLLNLLLFRSLSRIYLKMDLEKQ